MCKPPGRTGAHSQRASHTWARLLQVLSVTLVNVAGGASAATTLPVDAYGAPAPPALARAARTLRANDTAYLHYKPSSGSQLFEEGSAYGTLPGSMRAHLNIGATFSGSFTIYTRGGSINGHGSAIPSGSGRYETFRGTLVVRGGTGRYAHAHGVAGLYGRFDRKTYDVIVQTEGGRLSY
jgi:hypothetical protein